MRRLSLGLVLLLTTVPVVWTGLNLAPPHLVGKYGPFPGCDPRGEVDVEGIRFVLLGPGCARLGSTWLADRREVGATTGDILHRIGAPLGLDWGEPPAPSDEMPLRWIEFPRGLAIAKTEITNAQWERFEPDHERSELSPGDRNPVVKVSAERAREYCEWLSTRSGRSIRLPSESEWECACRADGWGEYAFGDDVKRLGEYAWYARNSDGRAHQVGTKRPNAWGIHDMHGNVREWCVNPGPGGSVVHRGGGWVTGPGFCRSSFRARVSISGTSHGFRPVMDPPAPGPGAAGR